MTAADVGFLVGVNFPLLVIAWTLWTRMTRLPNTAENRRMIALIAGVSVAMWSAAISILVMPHYRR